jgi:formylglycine-generating enzyme required for sulfatase activity
VRAALDRAAAQAPDVATQAQVAQARRELLAPPPPPIPAERFPARLATLGYEAQAREGVEWIIPPLCTVPAGQFRLGSDKKRDSQARDDELNRRVVNLPAYEIGRFPVTVAEYACFLNAKKRAAPGDWSTQSHRLDHPVVSVSWDDAFDYAAWLAERSGQPWRLPSEAEWEKAARLDPRDPQGSLGASSARIYPWGDTFDKMRCNTAESGLRMTSPVGWYGPDDPDPRAGRQNGASLCGAEDLASNVWEWTATEYSGDYTESEFIISRDSAKNRCLRGGSWDGGARIVRAAYRFHNPPDDANYVVIGLRLVLVPPGA